MRSRRVPVLRLGSRGPGGDARLLRLWRKRSQSFAIVRKRPQASAVRRTCRRDENRRETQNCHHFLRFVSQKCQQSQGIGGVVVAKRRTVITFYVSCLKSVNSHRGSGGSWSRNAELSSLFDSSRVFASQKCQPSQGSGGRGRETQNCRHFWLLLGSSRLKSVNRHRDRGGRGRETQNCRHFWTLLGSSRLKSVNRHRDPGGRGRETQNCRHFCPCLWREERREERGEKRDERREQRTEERRETRE